MKNQWMNKTLLVLSIQILMGTAYAADTTAETQGTTVGAQETAVASSVETNTTPPQQASSALQQQERQYSLIKKGDISAFYDVDYTYYRDTQLDLEMAQGSLYQLRVQENASHTLTNTFTVQYGILDNLTFTASLPLVAKTDNLKDTSTAGLGDISLGTRWEPFPLKTGRLPLILFGNISDQNRR